LISLSKDTGAFTSKSPAVEKKVGSPSRSSYHSFFEQSYSEVIAAPLTILGLTQEVKNNRGCGISTAAVELRSKDTTKVQRLWDISAPPTTSEARLTTRENSHKHA
jgi:hypothetical protein